jgi:hypothetical protein
MSSTATEGAAGVGGKFIKQSLAVPRPSDATGESESKVEEVHASTTIIERIGDLRRGYRAWMARQTAKITGKEPTIDSDA